MAQALPPAISALGLTKEIDQRLILQDINLQIPAGISVAIVGPNGAGKSTLLHALATLLPITSGKLELLGMDPKTQSLAIRRKLGMIGHQSMLYRDLSPLANLEFFGNLYGVSHARERARELLTIVGLAQRGDDPVRTFSRGMTQRVAIARALMHDPQLLLADEPFSGLDVASALLLESVFHRLHQEGKTVVLVNHDIPQSLALAQRVLVLKAGRLARDLASAEISAADLRREVLCP